MKETIYKIHTRKKMIIAALAIMLLLIFPIYMVGWQGGITAKIIGPAALYDLRWMFIFAYPLVPVFSIVSAALSFILAAASKGSEKTFYFIFSTLLLISSYFNLLEFF